MRGGRGQDLRRAEYAPLRPHLPDLDAPDHRGSCRLVQEQVGLSIRDDLLPGTGADQQTEQIAHGSAGYEERGVLAHPLGCLLLQPVDGGVVTETSSPSGALVMARSMSAVGSVTVSDRRSISLISTRFRAVDRQPFTDDRRPGRFHRIPRQVTLQSASRRSGRPASPGAARA